MQSSTGIALRWLGPQARALHPLLHQLHQRGGMLRGEVRVGFGSGIAARIGRRVARRLGIPAAGMHAFEVHIRDDGECLHWDRRFDSGAWVRSRFRPVGGWPGGWWIEQTGPLQLRLTVEVIDGGWHWRVLALRWHALRLPARLLRSTAYKRVEQGRYRFQVSVAVPLLGEVLSYGGLLDMAPLPQFSGLPGG
ncbi:MAG TPA: DUF4166 domain-containing protein [Burkholderiales bacterium]|jgi:hypothetical protein